MVHLIIELSKYLMIILFVVYVYKCFSYFTDKDYYEQDSILGTQLALIFLIHFLGYTALFFAMEDKRTLLGILYLLQVGLFILTQSLYSVFYPKSSRLVLNNMCMLMSVGFIMLARLNTDTCMRQMFFAAVSIVISLFVPVVVRKMKVLQKWTWLYAGVGIACLGIVLLLGAVTGGAKLSFDIGPVTIQPSEFVKILFVFFVAAALRERTDFKYVVLVTIAAAAHVLILVASTDLGAAVIMFVVYLIMLFVATRQPLYLFAGLFAGSGASVVAFKLFNHVRVRVEVWKDPFANWDNGYQIGNALFAIGTGGWVGMGLTQGMPESVPVVKTDFIFSAICEELGIIFGLGLILVCVSCYIMFLNIAMQIHEQFYKLVALGLGTCYIFQVFLNIGGVIKFIPMTGLTLPWVSYGGSSLLSTTLMFAIIQGLYILREDEEEEIERQRARELRKQRRRVRYDR
ncbi:MAG: FtsW/RodA/SpoVE family cell cycle protein [Clostridiales bacterium]|nr:FtsW/RodA/SpoVE family cell cycle protein [Clostridiales bacterium]